MVAEVAAVHGNSRRAVQDFLHSVTGVPVSKGAIQNILDRTSRALAPHYEAFGEAVRTAPVNHIDETTWKQGKKLEWLWLMCNRTAAFFKLHSHRSTAAFQELIQDWQGILVSDGYAVYQHWAHGRQNWLAHLNREAKGLSERNNLSPVPPRDLGLEGVAALMPHGERPAQRGSVESVLCQAYPSHWTVLNPTRRGSSCGVCSAKWVVSDFSSRRRVLLPSITTRREPCVLPCCGGNAALEARRRKVMPLSSASSASGKPAGCKAKKLFPSLLTHAGIFARYTSKSTPDSTAHCYPLSDYKPPAN